jgi:DNA repair exonuclease SbcCD ATPase subunit
MPYLVNILETLTDRLPELEWRLDELKHIHVSTLPPGLFRTAKPEGWLNPQGCVDEIKQDIKSIRRAHETRAGRFLAERVSQKINVLLRLCQVHRRKADINSRFSLDMKQLVTRQQWLKILEAEIERLAHQQAAVRCALEKNTHSSDALIALQQDLSEITRQLNCAEEKLASVSGFSHHLEAGNYQ